MIRQLNSYPPENKEVSPYKRETYWIEFSKWPGEPEKWQLFKRNFIISEAEYTKNLKEDQSGDLIYTLFSNPECHPWNLGEGEVMPETAESGREIISMDTKSFLKFMVDALNEKVVNDRIIKLTLEELDN